MATSFQVRALDLARAFTLQTRTNGTAFYYISDTQPAWMTEAVFAAHHDELPNDWRFGMCRQLAYAIAEHESADDARDVGVDIASDATTSFTADLLSWYADRPSRTEYADQWISDTGIDSVDGGIIGHLFAGQTYCIEQMLHCIIDDCEARDADLAQLVKA
jgi:hypothetical protein